MKKMKISELVYWLESQKSLYGDIEIDLILALENLTEKDSLKPEHHTNKKSPDSNTVKYICAALASIPVIYVFIYAWIIWQR